MSKKAKSRTEILEEEIRKLKQTIRDRDKTIRQLKSQFKTVESAWDSTEIYLKEVTNGKPLSEVIKTIKRGKPLNKDNEPCPKCSSKDLQKILYTGFHIVICSCGYRKRIDEEQEIGQD